MADISHAGAGEPARPENAAPSTQIGSARTTISDETSQNPATGGHLAGPAQWLDAPDAPAAWSVQDARQPLPRDDLDSTGSAPAPTSPVPPPPRQLAPAHPRLTAQRIIAPTPESVLRPPRAAEAAQPFDPDEAPWAEIAAPDAPRDLRPLRRFRLRGGGAVPRPDIPPADPAPSRIAYRLHRLWLRPMVRVLVRVGLPAWLLVMGGGALVADADRRAFIAAQWDGLQSGLATRPEFQVSDLTVSGASPTVEVAVRAMAPQTWPVSSFGLDLEALRAEIEALDAVARADLRVGADRRLSIVITERIPAAIWNSDEGLVLLDADGHRTARLLAREGRPDLPLLAGPGAARAVPEALSLMTVAAPLRRDVVGLVRMGERRWDLVLTGERRILLPETGAVAALERVLAQDDAQELLTRDIVHVDMRLPGRPTVRMSEAAVAEYRRMRTAATRAAAAETPAGGAMR